MRRFLAGPLLLPLCLLFAIVSACSDDQNDTDGNDSNADASDAERDRFDATDADSDTADVTEDSDEDIRADTDDDLSDAQVDDDVSDADDDIQTDTSNDSGQDGDDDPSLDADEVGLDLIDLGLSCDSSIADVRSAAAGEVSLDLCDVLVTYVNEDGFFIQAEQVGPAIYVFEQTDWTPTVLVGDQVSTQVTETGVFENNTEVLGHGAVAITARGVDVGPLIQDFSAGTLPDESNEHELVRIEGTVATLDRYTVLLDYGTASGVELVVNDYSSLCEGASVALNAVVFDTEAGLHFESANIAVDLQSVDPSGCVGANGGRAPAPGELLLNEFLEDPADNSSGDANCDGSSSRVNDEFMELVNISEATLNLGGVTIWDDFGMRHRFLPSTVLTAGEAIVVFGGGTPSCDPSARTTVSTTDQLGLSNGGDVITLRGADESLLLQVTYLDDVEDESYTLSPDLDDSDGSATGVSGYVAHSVADDGDNSLFSPGTTIDGVSLFPLE